MDKVVKLVFSPEAEEAYEGLIEKATRSKTERSVAKAIHTKIELIRSNYHYGNPIAKNLIPDEYKAKYGVTNLFRVELPDYWRMLYTLTDGEREIEIIAFILDILDHRKYDKKLGYVSK